MVILDVVTTRKGNLHNDLAKLMGLEASLLSPIEALYTAAYRPLREAAGVRVDSWPVMLQVGHPLPAVPLSLGAELCVRVDLEVAYQDACQRRKVDEVLEAE